MFHINTLQFVEISFVTPPKVNLIKCSMCVCSWKECIYSIWSYRIQKMKLVFVPNTIKFHTNFCFLDLSVSRSTLKSYNFYVLFLSYFYPYKCWSLSHFILFIFHSTCLIWIVLHQFLFSIRMYTLKNIYIEF